MPSPLCAHSPQPFTGYPRYKAASPRVPEGGWTMENFLTPNGRALNQSLASLRSGAVASEMRGALTFLRAYLKEEFETILELAEKYHDEDKGEDLIDTKAGSVPNRMSAWHRAIAEGAQKSTPKLIAGMSPRINRTGRRVLWDTARQLGMKPKDIDPRIFHASSKEIVKRLTGLAKTTGERVAGAVSQAIKDQLTLKQTIAKLRKRFPQLSLSRASTIARTELGRAADAGTIAAFHIYGKVSHVSVVGCMHVEVNSPRYRNIPTCNIQNVPAKDMGALEFHPNHTGAIVVAGFLKSNGKPPKLRLRRGTGRYD